MRCYRNQNQNMETKGEEMDPRVLGFIVGLMIVVGVVSWIIHFFQRIS
jgi:hypothetical protein